MAGQQNQIPVISSQRTRVLKKDFAENQNITFDLPLDTVLVGALIRLVGSVGYTYTGGTPKGRPEGAMDSLFSRIDCVIDGRRTVKSVTPHFLNMQQLMTGGNEAERFAEAGAAPIADNFPTTEGPFVFGTTGQKTTVRESVYLAFEHLHCDPLNGRELTYLNLKRANSATLTLQALNLASLNAVTGVTGLAFDSNKLQIEVTLIERQDIPADQAFSDWKQTFRRVQIQGEVGSLPIEIPSGAAISGFMMYTQNGNSATTTLVGRQPSSKIIGEMELRKNGQETIQKIDYKALQSKNKIDYGINAATAAGANRLDGVAHFNLLARRQLGTAFINRKDFGVDSLQLVIDSKPSGVVDYTNPAHLVLMTEEVVPVS